LFGNNNVSKNRKSKVKSDKFSQPSALRLLLRNMWMARFILCGGILIFGGISKAEENPWQALAQKKDWKIFCDRVRSSLEEHVRLKELRDVVFSPIPTSPIELPAVWTVQITGLSIPLPRYNHPTFQLYDKSSKKHRISGALSLQITANDKRSATLITVIPMAPGDVLKQTQSRYGLSLDFLEQISNLYHLPKTSYESQRDQYQFGLTDIQCESIEKSARPMLAVLGKYYFQEYRRHPLGIEQRGVESAAAYHLSQPIEAIVDVERIYLDKKTSKKTWVARLKTENPEAGVYIEVTYYFESYNGFIDSLIHWPNVPASGDSPIELAAEIQKLKTLINDKKL
jgi:hypothetical protein